MGQHFVRWYREGLWTPWGKVFDIGGATRDAISRIEKGVNPELAGGNDEASNGNGSLMRILPIALRFADLPSDQLLDRVHRVSTLTHRHVRSQIACGFYCLMVAALLKGAGPFDAYQIAVDTGLKIYTAPNVLLQYTTLLVAMINACGGSGQGEDRPKTRLVPSFAVDQSYSPVYGRPYRCPIGHRNQLLWLWHPPQTSFR
jgi:hypothetical protein